MARHLSLSARRAIAAPDSQPEVVSAFWKGIDVFRPIALAYAAYSLADRPLDLARPALGWTVLAVLGLWTVFLVLYRRRHLADAALLPLVLGGAEILNVALKLSFHRARPEVGFVRLDTYSFPSGHAMISAAAWGAFAYLAWGRVGRRWLVLATTFLAIVLIGFSRLYLGVHYLSDVLAGIAAGAAWLGVSLAAHAIWGERFAERAAGSRVDRLARRLTRS